MPESENKQRMNCQGFPKKKKAPKRVEEEPSPEEELKLPGEVTSMEEEQEEEEKEEEDAFPCKEKSSGGESQENLATTGFVLDDVYTVKKKTRPPFFCSKAPKSRYENMLPINVTNDHQSEAALKRTVIEHLGALRVTSDPSCKRQSAIIATIGPSCSSVSSIEDLLKAGMNIARFNMAYGDRCCQLNALENFRQALRNYQAEIGLDIPVGLLMDLKGPEIRTGRICPLYVCNPEDPQILLEKGSGVKLTTEIAFADKCTPNLIFIDYSFLPEYVRPGMKIFIDDGAIELFVQRVTDTEVFTFVEGEGILKNYRPLHIPMVPFPLPPITDIDIEDIELAMQENFDFIAVSKVCSMTSIMDLKGRITEYHLTSRRLKEKQLMVLAKISNFQALKNIDEIIRVADGIIIQRGDLGLELPPEKVFIAQREIIAKCNLANKPVICSTHLMRSMTERLLVDRSHIFDVASCTEDGADAVCLTGETAIGYYPADTIEQVHHVLREAEAADCKKYHFKEITDRLKPPIEPIVAIGMAACSVAEKIRANAIIVVTTSGKSASIISGFRPRCPVLAVTRFARTARQLHLWRSIFPLHYTGPCVTNNWFENLDYQFQFAISVAFDIGFVKGGDPLVLVSGYGKNTSFTNFLRVVYVPMECAALLKYSKDHYKNILRQKNSRRTNQPCLPTR